MASSSKEPGEIGDIQKLGSEKIKQLMKQDPKFISRLISDLDKQMHKLMWEKKKKQEQIEADEKELQRIDDIVRTHIKSQSDELIADIKRKTELRDNLKKQLEVEQTNMNDLLKNASSLIQKSRVDAGKLMRTTAAQKMEEVRGYSSAIPTTELLKGGTSRSSTQ